MKFIKGFTILFFLTLSFYSQADQFHINEFGIYDSNNEEIITTGALDVPKRLAYLYNNPKKLVNFFSHEKIYITDTYNWTENKNASIILRLIDLREHPRDLHASMPEYPFPFVLVAEHPILDFIGSHIRTSPSATREEAIDKMFSWLTSSSPGFSQNAISANGKYRFSNKRM